MKQKGSRHGQGFTLTEVLVVVAIVALLVALLLPVLNSARVRALEAQEISQLRQMAVAHSTYVADYDDVEPGTSVPLIAGGYAPKEMVRSPFDPFPLGWANEGRRGPNEAKTDYKDSFVTLKQCAGVMFFPAYRESQNGGWLIAAGPQINRLGNDVWLQGTTYRRLTFGGSVIQRTFPTHSTPEGGVTLALSDCFSDDKVVPARNR